MSKSILVIPDSHSSPGHSNERYEWLAKLVLDLKPTYCVDIGDWFCMPSLSSHDVGTKGFEGRRYKQDINAGLDAQDRFYNITRAPKKKGPKYFRTLGNHEHRITRAINNLPILEGTISLRDLQSKEYGFEEYGFLDPLVLEGITFQHYFTSGLMGRPVGGENHAKSLITKQLTSCVQGHSHTFDFARRTDPTGRKVNGLVVGVYQDYTPPYAASTGHLWDRGVAHLTNVENGNFDIQWIGLDTIKRTYGKA
jgi:hypothetical protein